jgi:hypothetical protein
MTEKKLYQELVLGNFHQLVYNSQKVNVAHVVLVSELQSIS